jgi:hypothetical protein
MSVNSYQTKCHRMLKIILFIIAGMRISDLTTEWLPIEIVSRDGDCQISHTISNEHSTNLSYCRVYGVTVDGI